MRPAQLPLVPSTGLYTEHSTRRSRPDPAQMQASLDRQAQSLKRAHERLQRGDRLDQLTNEELFSLPPPEDFDLHKLCSTWNEESRAYSDLRFERGDW